jgi:hypothetical protein
MHPVQDFQTSIKYGKAGEQIFKEEFLDFMGIEYVDVTNSQKFQVIDTDFKTTVGTYEVKLNYKDDKHVIIEDYTNINTKLAKESKGWFYKSESNLIVFISKATKVIVMIPFTKEFKDHYEQIKDIYQLKWNSVSQSGNRKWQSAYRRIPLEAITGFYSMYKRII